MDWTIWFDYIDDQFYAWKGTSECNTSGPDGISVRYSWTWKGRQIISNNFCYQKRIYSHLTGNMGPLNGYITIVQFTPIICYGNVEISDAAHWWMNTFISSKLYCVKALCNAYIHQLQSFFHYYFLSQIQC